MITPFVINVKTKKVTYVKNLGWVIRKAALVKRIEVEHSKDDPDEFMAHFYLKGYIYVCTFTNKRVLKQFLIGQGMCWKSKRFHGVTLIWFGKRYRIPNI
jgi:hypothetical protein